MPEPMSHDAAQPEPGTPPTAAAGDEFICHACGGRMEFDPAHASLLCSFCGATRSVGEAGTGKTIVEYDLEHGLAESAVRGYGVPVHTVSCAQCGAVVSYTEGSITKSCDFCGSAKVMERSDHRNPIRPESVVPFAIDRKAATDRFSAWLGGLWLRPSNLKKLARVSELNGMYVPY